MELYLAIDAGGSRTVGVLADGQRELARAEAGSIKRMRVQQAEAEINLDRLLKDLSHAADIELNCVTHTCIGTSGVSVSLVTDWIRQAFASRVAGSLLLCGDEEIALDAAFQGGRGVLVIAGTGSNIGGRTANGQVLSVGGWGPALGDEGSGHWIGSQAMRAAFCALNADSSSALIEAVQRYWRLSSREDLVARANEIPPPDFAALTPLVVECAAQGDAVCMETLRQAGEELAQLTLQAIRKLLFLEDQREHALPEVAWTGSILCEVEPVRRAMSGALLRIYPALHIRAEAIDAVQGALWRARHA